MERLPNDDILAQERPPSSRSSQRARDLPQQWFHSEDDVEHHELTPAHTILSPVTSPSASTVELNAREAQVVSGGEEEVNMHRYRLRDSLAPTGSTTSRDSSFDELDGTMEGAVIGDRLPEPSRQSSIDGPGNDPTTNLERLPRTWRPLALSKPVLSAFTGLFVSLVAMLELLNFLSRKNQGLATVSDGQYYLWKFGPTFVLTIVVTLWSRVEYRSKQVMPWKVMASNQCDSVRSKGFNLNYLTASTPVSIYESIKAGHLPVLLALLGMVMLRLLIIFSTGLLLAEDQMMTHQGEVSILDRFDFRKQAPDDTPLDSLWIMWAIGTHNLSWPSGVTPNFVVQSIQAHDADAIQKMTFEAEVFEASFDSCEAFNASLVWEDRDNDYYRMFPSDFIDRYPTFCGYDTLDGSGWPLGNLSAADAFLLSENIYVLQPCSNATPHDQHMLFMTFPLFAPNGTLFVSGIACQPKYVLSRRNVCSTLSHDTPSRILEVSEDISEILDIGLPPVNLTNLFVGTVRGNSLFGSLEELPLHPAYGPNPQYYQDIAYLLNIFMPQRSVIELTETEVLQRASQQSFRSVMALLVQSHFATPINTTTSGTFELNHRRLCVSVFSLRLMEVILALLAVCSLCICFMRHPLFTRDPEPLAAHAFLLRRSPTLESSLRYTGGLMKKEFKRILGRERFICPPEDRDESSPICTYISVSEDLQQFTDSRVRTNAEAPSQQKWWLPLASSWWYRIMIILLTISFITALEVLYRVSARDRGISDTLADTYGEYTWLYIPSITMAATSLAYGSLDAAARTLHPFHQLLQKNLRFRELFFEPLGEFTLRAIVYSTRRGYFALTAILITSLLGPTLTIVTSGLFTTTSIQFPDAITVDVRSWFNIETDPLGIEAYSLPCRNPGQVTSTAIEFGNVSYPQWTYKDLAFAGISLKPDELKSASSVTARVPAIRPKMNCTIQDFYDRSNNSFISSDDTYVRFPGPPGCGFGLDLSPVTILNGSYYDSFYVGTWLPSDPMLEQAWGEVDIYSCSDDRAHAWFEVARFDEGELQDFSLVHCMPYVEVLHTIVTFTVPDLEIDLSNGPPRPDDSAEPSRFFNNITMQPICMNTVNGDRSSGDLLDPFFTTAVMGRQGVPMAELANPANPEPLLHRMQEVYGANAVQGLNHLFRVPVASNASFFEASDMLTSPLNATLAVNRQRLVQSMLATRILEAVLLAMAVCAGVHFALTPNARILPKDPGSVAAKMSLFAGSELVRQLPEGENQELETAFGNRVVSLGWWGENGGGEAGSGGESERRFGIDLRPAAEE